MKRDVIINERSRWGKVIRPYIMPEEKSVNVDTPVDLKLAELLIEQGMCNNSPIVVK